MPDDDLSVAAEVLLYRLLNPEDDIDWDFNDNRWIIKSSAFQNTTGTDRMSVVLGDTLEEADRPPEDACRAKPTWFIASLTAQSVRGERQGIQRAPLAEEPAHGNVVGDKSKSRRRRLRDSASWVKSPPVMPAS